MKKFNNDDVVETIISVSGKVALLGIGVATLGLVTKKNTLKTAGIVTSFAATIIEKVTDKVYEKKFLLDLESYDDIVSNFFDDADDDDIDYDDFSDPLDDDDEWVSVGVENDSNEEKKEEEPKTKEEVQDEPEEKKSEEVK